MIPGVNPRQLRQAMKQMGMTQDDIEASEVIITTPTKTYRFASPSVQKVGMQGQVSWQIAGDYVEEESKAEISISDDDVSVVTEQAGVSQDEARKALEQADGDIAQAIMNLSQ